MATSAHARAPLPYAGNSLGEAAGAALGKALEKNSTLTSLDVGCAPRSAARTRCLAHAAPARARSSVPTAARAHASAPLLCAGNGLGEAAGAALGKALETNSTLTSLDVRSKPRSAARSPPGCTQRRPMRAACQPFACTRLQALTRARSFPVRR